MRICVFGAGAIGSHLAVRLARAGEAVSVVARGANLAAIRAHGITLLSGENRIVERVQASDTPAQLGEQDLVIVTVKAHDLPGFADACASLLTPSTAVLFLQNGIPWWYANGLQASRPAPPDLAWLDPGGRLKAAVSPENILGGAIYSPNELLEPGVVHQTSPGRSRLLIGAPDDRESDPLIQLRTTLERSGMQAPRMDDIRVAIWTKLAEWIAGSGLCVLTESRFGTVIEDPDLLEIHTMLTEELVAIAKAHGVLIAPAEPPRSGPGLERKPSILQDYERGKKMEISSTFQAAVAFARAAELPVPVLKTVSALIGKRAQRRAQ